MCFSDFYLAVSYADIDADGLIERVRALEGVKQKGDCIATASTYGLSSRLIWNVSVSVTIPKLMFFVICFVCMCAFECARSSRR